MADEKFFTFSGIPVGTSDDTYSDHKILVNSTDNTADFLLNKQAPDTQIGFTEDPQNPGKFLVLLDKDAVEDTSSKGAEYLRPISPFSVQTIDSEYTNIAGSQDSTKAIIFPITISIGEIKSFSIISKTTEDFELLDKVQVAITSNTENNVAGSKVEFFAQYGYNDTNDNLIKESDGKTFTLYDSAEYNSIKDLDCNYHFAILLFHIDSSSSSATTRGLLAKSSSGSPLVEVGRNANYCGQQMNIKTILSSSFIDPTDMTISSSFGIQTNLQSNFPYIEFYQMRG